MLPHSMGLLELFFGKKFPFKFVYSDEYWMVNIGKHVFPVRKYRLVYEKLIALGAKRENFLEPRPALDEDLFRVHTPRYIRRLKAGELSPAEIHMLELPYSTDLVKFAWLQAGGTILAARQALADGLCVHIGGGFHHAFADHGEGFCVVNDVAAAVEALKAEGKIERVMVVDCDLHQGNGTAGILGRKDYVFTFSIHQMDCYPADKPSSTLDVGLWAGDGDDKYLAAIREHFPRLFRQFRPDIVIYLAGSDPLEGDQLGGLTVTKDGLFARDMIVLESARGLGIPVAVVFAGGYARDIQDSVDVHINTIRAAQKVARKWPKQ